MILRGEETVQNHSSIRTATAALCIIFASAFATLLSSCSSDEKDPNTLVLYSGRSESLIGNIVDQFEDASGIDVQVKYGKTFPLAAVLSQPSIQLGITAGIFTCHSLFLYDWRLVLPFKPNHHNNCFLITLYYFLC